MIQSASEIKLRYVLLSNRKNYYLCIKPTTMKTRTLLVAFTTLTLCYCVDSEPPKSLSLEGDWGEVVETLRPTYFRIHFSEDRCLVFLLDAKTGSETELLSEGYSIEASDYAHYIVTDKQRWPFSRNESKLSLLHFLDNNLVELEKDYDTLAAYRLLIEQSGGEEEPDPGDDDDPKPIVRPQCAAITQQGSRCKRKAVEGSIYCWQHQ